MQTQTHTTRTRHRRSRSRGGASRRENTMIAIIIALCVLLTIQWLYRKHELIKGGSIMKETDPYEMDSDIVKEALEKGWVPPNSESLEGKLHDTLPNLSANWSDPLRVIADLIPQRRHAEVAQTLVAFTEPISVYEFLADVYLTDELEED